MTHTHFAAPLLLAAFATSAFAQASPPADRPFGVAASVRLTGDVTNIADAASSYHANELFATELSIAGIKSKPNAELRSWAAVKGSLKSGTIGARSGATCVGPYGTAGSYVGAQSVIQMWDTVTLTAGTSINLGLIPLQLELDGKATGIVPNRQGSYAQARLQVYDVDRGEYLLDYDSDRTTGSVLLDTKLGPDGSMLEPLVERRFMISYQLFTYSNIGASVSRDSRTEADYFNTLHFRWNLPDSVSFRSESGVFAPPAIQAVPEPASFVALAVGAAAILRRRRARR